MEIKVDAKIPDVIGELLSKVQNRKPLMMEISGIMLDEVRQNFEVQGRPRWTPLAPSTIKDRTRKGYWPGKILQRTGQLLRSITASADENTAQVGTNKVYAAVHQFGGLITQAPRSSIYVQQRYKKGKKKGKFKKVPESQKQFGQGFTYKARNIRIPARPFLNLSDSAIDEIKEAIFRYLNE